MPKKVAHQTEEIVEALKATNGLVSLAAKMLKVTPQAIYKRAKKVQSIQQVIDDCRKELIDLGELSLRKKIIDGEGWAVALVLKTLGRNRGYVERQEIAPTDPSGQKPWSFHEFVKAVNEETQTGK